MNKCIYYKNDKLSFNGREHIIPASLGGKNMLPKGVVSDEANNYFSTFESKALRETIVAGIRNYIGPGARGNRVVVRGDGLITCKKQYNPHINVLKSKNINPVFSTEESFYRLGFMYDKHTMLLPQVIFSFDSNLSLLSQIYSPGEFDNKYNNVGACFSRIDTICADELKEVETEFKPNKFFLILGAFHKKWYFYMNIPFITLPKALELIRKQRNNTQRVICASVGGEYDFSYKMDGGFNDGSFQFLFIKTAFNVLAYKMGQEFVLDFRFDRLRNLILGKIDYNVLYPCKLESVNNWLKNRMERDPHIVLIVSNDEGKLFAFVSFYGEMLFVFEMAQDITEYIYFAYICDWRNGKEWVEEF